MACVIENRKTRAEHAANNECEDGAARKRMCYVLLHLALKLVVDVASFIWNLPRNGFRSSIASNKERL